MYCTVHVHVHVPPLFLCKIRWNSVILLSLTDCVDQGSFHSSLIFTQFEPNVYVVHLHEVTYFRTVALHDPLVQLYTTGSQVRK